MIYEGENLDNQFKILDKAIEIAKTGEIKLCNRFLKKYAEYLYYECTDLHLNSLQNAYDMARDKLGFTGGYYHDNIRKLIEYYYNAKHPIYPDKYELTPDEIYNLDQKYNNNLNINLFMK